MIPPNILSRFNPETKVPYLEFSRLRVKLEPFGEIIRNQEQKIQNSNYSVSSEMVKLGLEIQEKIKELQREIKIKLVKLFFSLSDQEMAEIGEEFEEMYQMVVDARPSLVDFLLLPPADKKPQAGSL